MSCWVSCFFFFSSRRRHTRWPRDWSSDVCSSDLDPTSVLKFFALTDDLLGSPDILVNNAGVGIFRSVAEMTPDEWHRVIDTNLTGVFHCCHAALERFRRTGKGFIVNISSLAGKNANKALAGPPK